MGDYALPNDFPALTDNKAGTLTDVRLSDTTDPGVETPDATPIDDVVDYIPGRRDTETLHSKGKAVRQGTNDDDKKVRQKLQNRKAAERSRSKRKQEQMSIEIAVQNMHTENEQLRARLAVLSANRPKTAASSSANIGFPPLVNPATQAGTDIDYNYLAKLQAELASAKATLLEKELEHVRLKGGKVDADADGLRQLLLSHNTKFTMLRAEANSLDNTLAQLRTQRDELGKQSSVIRRELEARKVSRAMTTSDEQVGENRITEAERLMDVSGWMEAASNDWNQNSVIPTQRELEGQATGDIMSGEDG